MLMANQIHGFAHTMKLRSADRRRLNYPVHGPSRYAKLVRRLREQVSANGQTLGITTRDVKDALLVCLEFAE